MVVSYILLGFVFLFVKFFLVKSLKRYYKVFIPFKIGKSPKNCTSRRELLPETRAEADGKGMPFLRLIRLRNCIMSAVSYFKNVTQELKKITWPTRKETIISMIMVFVMVTFVALFLFLVDSIVGYIIQLILG